FEVPNQQHPYRKYEILTKIAQNVTVRSNVFAVWCTVGFFEVDGDGRLGREIGREVGRHKRHRFFAIIDRSTLEPWVRYMSRLIYYHDPNSFYDVSVGWAAEPLRATKNHHVYFLPGTPGGYLPVPNPPPLLANHKWDPRKDYSLVRI